MLWINADLQSAGIWGFLTQAKPLYRGFAWAELWRAVGPLGEEWGLEVSGTDVRSYDKMEKEKARSNPIHWAFWRDRSVGGKW